MSLWTIAFIIFLILAAVTFEFGALVSLIILLAIFLVGLVAFGFVLTRAQSWRVWFMVLLLAFYGVAIFLVLVSNEICTPVNQVTIAEQNATRVILLLAVACLVIAAILVHHRAYAFAVACLAVPPLLSFPVVAIIRLIVPGERGCGAWFF